ncbi:hypothetical protein D3C80_1592410 [compost metagenome]
MGEYLVKSDPATHAIEPLSNTSKPMNCLGSFKEKCVASLPLDTNSITPAKPTKSPATIAILVKEFFHSRLSSKVIHNGAPATTIAVILLGIYCSAHITAPFPHNRRISPVIPLLIIVERGGNFSLL